MRGGKREKKENNQFIHNVLETNSSIEQVDHNVTVKSVMSNHLNKEKCPQVADIPEKMT